MRSWRWCMVLTTINHAPATTMMRHSVGTILVDSFVFRRYGVIIVYNFGCKIGGFYVILHVYVYIHRIPFLTARLTCPMRMVRPWPVAVLTFPWLARLGNAATANAMDKSPTGPLRGPSMTARRFWQVKVQDGNDQTAVWKMCDHMQRAKNIVLRVSWPCRQNAHVWCYSMARWAGVGGQCEHYLESQSVNGSGAGRITACIVPLGQ